MNTNFTSLRNSPVYTEDIAQLNDTGKKYSFKIWLIILSVLIPLGWPFLVFYTYKYHQDNKGKIAQRILAMEQFAKDNAFEFIALHKGFVSQSHENNRIKVHLPYGSGFGDPWYLLKGTMRNLGFYYAMVTTYSEQQGVQKASKTCSIFSVALPIAMPVLFINSKKNNLFGLENSRIQIDSIQEYHLEGDFDRYFTVHAQQNDQINVLKVLTPEVMALLKEHDAFDVWIEGNQMSFITSAHMVRFFAETESFFALSEALLSEIDALARTLNNATMAS